jgi:thioredoxin-like negative regulator of GroEL
MKKVNFDELQKLKQNHEWLLVKFSSKQCGPCITMTDVLAEVTPTYPQLTTIEADAMENIEELMHFGLGNFVPQTILYHNGIALNLEKPYQLVGLKTPEVVGQVLSHFITT